LPTFFKGGNPATTQAANLSARIARWKKRFVKDTNLSGKKK